MDPPQQLATEAIVRQALWSNRGMALCRSCLVKLVGHNNVSTKRHVQNAVQALFQEPGPFLKKNECGQCRMVGINRALTAPAADG
jgi:hypothetical protein